MTRIENRRLLADAEPMPPELAEHFSLSQMAVMAVIAADVRKSGKCMSRIATLGERARCSAGTASVALRNAEAQGLIAVRRDSGPVAQPVTITILSAEWAAWIKNGRS